MAPRGSRGGRSGGPREPLPRPIQVSKKLSWLLRHGAEEEGLTFLPGGFLPVSAVLANRKFRSLQVTFAEVKDVIAADEKQRYTLQQASSETTDADVTKPDAWVVRANQGHSVKLQDDQGLLRPVTKETMPEIAVHGTTHAAWPLIVASGGLKPMKRNHVHFASGLPEGFTSLPKTDAASAPGSDGDCDLITAPVISGMRKTSTILIFLDLPKAIDAGLKFGVSDNRVVLTEGDSEGLVSLTLFKRVEDRTGLGVLVEDGRVVQEAPESWGKGRGKGKG